MARAAIHSGKQFTEQLRGFGNIHQATEKVRRVPKQQQNATNTKSNGVTVGFEAKLWAAAARRDNMNAAEHKHVCLGTLLLNHIGGKIVHGDTRVIHSGLTDQTVAAPRNWSD